MALPACFVAVMPPCVLKRSLFQLRPSKRCDERLGMMGAAKKLIMERLSRPCARGIYANALYVCCYLRSRKIRCRSLGLRQGGRIYALPSEHTGAQEFTALARKRGTNALNLYTTDGSKVESTQLRLQGYSAEFSVANSCGRIHCS